MRGNKFLYLTSVIWIMTSCNEQERHVAGDEFSQQAGDYKLSLRTMGTNTSDAELLEFKLHLQRKDGEDLVAFDGVKNLIQSRIYYYSYRIKEAIYLEQGGQRVPVDFCHFERSFDLKKGRNFMLAFDKSNINQTKPYQVIIDSEVLATGPVKFSITPN